MRTGLEGQEGQEGQEGAEASAEPPASASRDTRPRPARRSRSMGDVARPVESREAGRSGPPYVASSFCDLVECLVDLGEVRRVNLRGAGLAGPGGVDVLAGLAERGPIFLLVVVVLC